MPESFGFLSKSSVAALHLRAAVKSGILAWHLSASVKRSKKAQCQKRRRDGSEGIEEISDSRERFSG
jgi:hypothetical protein